jgi:hypothetical protein
MSLTGNMRAPLDLAKSLLGVAGAVEVAAAVEAVAEAAGVAEGAEAAEVAGGAEVALGAEAALAAEVADARSTLVQSVLRPETGLACLALISRGGQPNRARRP